MSRANPAEREFRIVAPDSGRALSPRELPESEILWLRADTGDTDPVHLSLGTIERLEINGASPRLLEVLRESLRSGGHAGLAAPDGFVEITWEDCAATPRTKTLVSLAVRFEVKCSGCRLAVAVGDLSAQVRCPACQTDIVLGRDFAHEVLADLIDDYLDDMEPGLTGSLATRVGPARSNVRGQFRRAAPTCIDEACARELPAPVLEAAWTAGEDAVVCPACQRPTPIHRADLAALAHRDAKAIMLEGRPAPRLAGGGGACVFCDECGDAAYLQEFTEAVDCDTCEESISIDRATWQRAIAHAGVKEQYFLLERMPPRPDPRAPSGERPAPATAPAKPAWTGLTVGLMIPGLLVALAFGSHEAGLDVAVGADASSALMLVGAVVLLARWVAYALMLLRGRAALEFGPDALTIPPVALLAFRTRRVAFADLEGCAVHQPRHKLELHLRNGDKVVIPDLFVWNRLRIILELRRYVPSLG